MILVFNTEKKAIEAQAKIRRNYFENLAINNDGKVLDNNLNKVKLSDLTENEIAQLKIFSYNQKGKMLTNKGLTEEIVTPYKAFNQNKWFFKKMSEYCEGVEFDEEIQSIPDDWHQKTVADAPPKTLPEGWTYSMISSNLAYLDKP
jgi:hypothetical protein